jgi:hypothetical protein
VRLAAAVLRDGGRYSLVTAMGPGRGSSPLVKVWDVDWYGTYPGAAPICSWTSRSCRCEPAPAGIFPIAETGSVMAYGERFRGGVNLGTGPVDGMNDGFSTLFTARARGGSAQVKAFVVTSSSDAHLHGGQSSNTFLPIITELGSFDASASPGRGGVSVSAVSTPTGADIVAVPASPGAPRLRRFTYDARAGSFQLAKQFRAFAGRAQGATGRREVRAFSSPRRVPRARGG